MCRADTTLHPLQWTKEFDHPIFIQATGPRMCVDWTKLLDGLVPRQVPLEEISSLKNPFLQPTDH